jgi:heme exporter protein B
MPGHRELTSLWWLIHKDLTRELRTHKIWPGMLLLGVVLTAVLATHVNLPIEAKEQVVGGLLWFTVVFAGTLALERSFASERDDGCWQTLTLYPIAPSMLFLAKMAVNLGAIVILELFIIPLFVLMTDVPLIAHPGAMALIAGLGSIGFAAVGTLMAAAMAGLRNSGGLVALLFLPLVMPVVLAEASATSMMLADQLDQFWWRWIYMLATFAVVFTVAGVLVFEFIIEE